MDKKNEIFGMRLKELRNKSGKSQDKTAKEIGVSRATYSHYENNHVEPDIELIRKMADVFNVTTDYLLGRTDFYLVDEDQLEKNRKQAIINKIITEFPDANLMFNDLANMTADDMQDVYDFVKFKVSQKKTEGE